MLDVKLELIRGAQRWLREWELHGRPDDRARLVDALAVLEVARIVRGPL